MPTSQLDLKQISLARIKAAKLLLDEDDYDGCAYLMGCGLECALKSVICKTLKVINYPEFLADDKEVPRFFMTHSFVRLLLLSGLSDIFEVQTNNPLASKNWGKFTIQYVGEWTAMRYKQNQFTKKKVSQLYNYLFLDKNSIINVIDSEKRW